MKFKCKDCGHIFEGDLSTTCCPDCGGDVVPYNNGRPRKIFKIAFLVIVSIVLVILMLKSCKGCHEENIYSISVTQDSVYVYVEASCVGDSLDLKELRDSCQVIVLDSNEVQIENPRLYSLKTNKLNYEIGMFEPGCTYRVVLSKRKGGKEICSDVFTIPMPPTPPVISVEPAIPETDPKDKCRLLGTYMVKIVVKEGKADKFCIDGVEYSTNIINGIRPRPKNSQYVIVKAYNSEDKLWSDSVSYKLPPINRNAISAPDKDEIQRIFDAVANRKMMAGDAVDNIAKGVSIPVNVHGKRSNLEDELQVSYQTRTRLVVKKVNYRGTECSRSIISIEI